MNMMRMLRKHMNKLLILLVILIALAFGISGTMQTVISSWIKGKVWARMCGRDVKHDEFMSARNRLTAMQGGRDEKVSEDDVWEYLVMLEEAKRTGMVINARELQDAILARYREMCIMEEIRESSKDQMDFYGKLWRYQQLSELQKKARREAISFSAAEYSKLILKRYDMSVPDFEQTYREVLLMDKLVKFVRGSSLASSKSVYDMFVEGNHQRKVDYLHLDSENYAGRVELKEEEIKKLYDERKNSYYKKPARLAFEYVMARFDDMKALLTEPTEEELKAFYERNLNLLFQRPQPGTEEVVPPEEKYKPFEEVREEVEYFLGRERSEKKARELGLEVVEKINALEEISLLEAAELAAGSKLCAGETKPFTDMDYSEKLKDEFGFCRQAQNMFDGVITTGGKFVGPHTCDKGVFYYRLSRHEPDRSKEFDQVREEIEKFYINQQASKAAGEDAKRIVEDARKGKGFTKELVLKEKLTRISTDFFKTSLNKGEIKTIEGGGREVIMAAFGLEKVDDVAEPVEVEMAGKPHYYLVQYKARMDPNPAEFMGKRQGLIEDAKLEAGSDLFKEWKEDLMRRANIEKLYLKKQKEKEKEKAGEPGEAGPGEGQEDKETQQPESESEKKQPEEKTGQKPEGEKKQPEKEQPEKKRDK